MTSMFQDTLARFNRKERYLLLEWALGAKDFPLSDQFRSELGTEIGVDVPDRVFVAMDYHLDWLYAALELTFGDAEVGTARKRPAVPEDGDIGASPLTFTQEDIDLLVVFERDGRHHVVMVEAKGYSGWTNKQLRHKARRLASIFGLDGSDYPAVRPTLVLTGPSKSSKINTEGWPQWAADYRFLPMPEPVLERRQVTRCTGDGVSAKAGDYWMTKESHWKA